MKGFGQRLYRLCELIWQLVILNIIVTVSYIKNKYDMEATVQEL
ncbi:hypothetical protein AB7942_23330 [Neobacillus sp. BF23-41]